MEDQTFATFMMSEPFTIVVNDAEGIPKEYLIHSNLLASLSRPLRILVLGSYKEAHGKRVVWDTDERTVALFCEFAYTGKYHVPRFEATRRDNPAPAAVPEAFLHDVNGAVESDADVDCEEDLLSRTESEPLHTNDSTDADSQTAARHNGRQAHPEEIIIDQCIAHARLLIFADSHELETLVSLSSANLVEYLDSIWVYSGTAVTELLKIPGEFPECLQAILADHIVNKISGLWLYGPLREALEKRSNLMSAVISALVGS